MIILMLQYVNILIEVFKFEISKDLNKQLGRNLQNGDAR